MRIFCIEEFKIEFEKLIKKSSYAKVEKEIIDYFFDKDVQHLKSGTRLNNSDDTPYIKKRLNGSGGFRIYYLLLIKNDCVYLMFLHPKTGSLGFDNINDDSKSLLYKKVLERINNNELYMVLLEEDKLAFKKQPLASAKKDKN